MKRFFEVFSILAIIFQVSKAIFWIHRGRVDPPLLVLAGLRETLTLGLGFSLPQRSGHLHRQANQVGIQKTRTGDPGGQQRPKARGHPLVQERVRDLKGSSSFLRLQENLVSTLSQTHPKTEIE